VERRASGTNCHGAFARPDSQNIAKNQSKKGHLRNVEKLFICQSD
jgi:hypothetical protein